MSFCRVSMLRAVAKRSFSMGSVLGSRGDSGSGVGHGGGAGGSIREAGGKFGEIEAAAENAYFRKLEAEQLKQLRKRHDEEIEAHEREIERHKEAIRRHKENREKLAKAGKKDD